MKPIDDAMIIAAVTRNQFEQPGLCVIGILKAISGQPAHVVFDKLMDAEKRRLILYDVVESRTEAKPEDGWKAAYNDLLERLEKVAAGVNAIDREYDQQVEYLKGSVDGLRRLIGELSKDVSHLAIHSEVFNRRMSDMERQLAIVRTQVFEDGAADPIHDEESEQDGS